MFESGVMVLQLQSHSEDAVIAETEDAVCTFVVSHFYYMVRRECGKCRKAVDCLSVRPSVRPSVRLFHQSTAALGLLLRSGVGSRY